MNMITNKKAIASMIITILLIGLTTPIFAATKTATVKSQTLMYSSKSTSSTEKAQICAGQKVYVLNTDGNWCNVKWEVKGYAHKNYVNKSNGAVIKGGPNINSEPKKGSTRYGDLRNGNVTFLDNKKLYGDYYKVSITVTGYVQKSALNISSTGSSSTGNNKPSSSSSSTSTTGSILAALLRLTVKGAEKGAEVTLKAFSGLLGRLKGGSSTAKPSDNKLYLDKSDITIKEGKTEKITATFNNKTVKPMYESNDSKVATVDSVSGKITAKKQGTAIIKAKYNGKTAQITVTVIPAQGQSTKPQQPTQNLGNESFAVTAKNCMTVLYNNKFKYGNVGYNYKDNPPSENTSNKKIDCSGYVSWVIYEYAKQKNNTTLMNDFKTNKNSGTTLNYMKNHPEYFESKGTLSNLKVSELKEGDIIVKDGHIEIFAKYDSNQNYWKYRCYNAGRDIERIVSGGACNNNTSAYKVFRIK